MFFAEICTPFLLKNAYKRVFGIILVCLDPELLAQTKKT